MNYSVAASYHPWKHLRLQAEYTRQTYNHIVGSKNSNGLYLMVSAIF